MENYSAVHFLYGNAAGQHNFSQRVAADYTRTKILASTSSKLLVLYCLAY